MKPDADGLPDVTGAPAASADEPREQEADAPLLGEEMTPEQLEETRAYGRRSLACDLIDAAIDVVFLAFMALVVARPLDAWLAEFPLLESRWWRLVGLFLVLTGLHQLVSLPLSFYSGYLLEHRFGLSRQSLRRWFGRYLLQSGLSVAFSVVLILGLYWLIGITGPFWWLAAAAASFLVGVVVGQLAPVLILPLFYKVERLDDEQLADRFHRLVEGTTLRIEGVYRLRMSRETKKANAMLAGLGHTRRVLLGDTLLESFTPEEIDVVLAHEVGHHVYHHITKLLVGGSLYSLVSFLLCDLALRWQLSGMESWSYATLPVWTLPLLLLTLTVFSLVLSPLRNAVSRHFERQCDRYALQRTGLKGAYRTAFLKLARLNKADPDPPWLEMFLLHDHPPIKERLAMADEV